MYVVKKNKNGLAEHFLLMENTGFSLRQKLTDNYKGVRNVMILQLKHIHHFPPQHTDFCQPFGRTVKTNNSQGGSQAFRVIVIALQPLKIAFTELY